MAVLHWEVRVEAGGKPQPAYLFGKTARGPCAAAPLALPKRAQEPGITVSPAVCSARLMQALTCGSVPSRSNNKL